MANREFRLRVEGWRYSRHAMIQANTLLMEVARMACSHCPTCSNRIRTLESRLQGNGTSWRFVNLNGGVYLAVEPKQMPATVGDYLSGLIGLQISES
ncbi:MAG: hypothetical protein A3F98_03915 [Candidatus Yanofskybacteria bacterium RIFCSPLOWO2_12_FULL_41_8]|nr:MAG: hypothetical protein A3F98_03915 [Candidatus Yanofskybacteria bacterium RIFCSPLOWO2_12_FULL_41_8]